ncbi:MAG: hypothetical protein JWM21_4564 [Acidobacteria bacterium]|nr:hypothetical protein [Acidobacteriota bacterium]
MNKFRFTMNALAVVIFTLTFASLANAQATRTWVSGVGDDANPCSRTAPCKTFAGAISKTALGGEIDALDPGGFGTLNITKAITIDGSGTFASVLNSNTNGFNINAGPNDVVTLRGLSIQGASQGVSPGVTGIKMNSGKALNVVNCIILNQSTNGIEFSLSANAVSTIKNVYIKNCGGSGLSATTTSGQVKVAIRDSSFVECGTGLFAKGNSRVSADTCAFYMNTGPGVNADGATGVGVANISNSSIYNNGGAGVQAQTGGAVARINNCDIIQNTGNGALVGAGGEVDTWGNNRFVGNADGAVCTSCTASTPH